jgi:hypothetical protein
VIINCGKTKLFVGGEELEATDVKIDTGKLIEPLNVATIHINVSERFVGVALAVLEWYADVFLVDRGRLSGMQMERWSLRSERFPSRWDGREARMQVEKEGAAVTFTCGGTTIRLKRSEEVRTIL